MFNFRWKNYSTVSKVDFYIIKMVSQTNIYFLLSFWKSRDNLGGSYWVWSYKCIYTTCQFWKWLSQCSLIMNNCLILIKFLQFLHCLALGYVKSVQTIVFFLNYLKTAFCKHKNDLENNSLNIVIFFRGCYIFTDLIFNSHSNPSFEFSSTLQVNVFSRFRFKDLNCHQSTDHMRVCNELYFMVTT